MKEFLLRPQWGWKTGGVMLGITLVLATMLVKPIGVSTQYTVLDTAFWSSIDSLSIPQNKQSQSAYDGANSDAYNGFIKPNNTRPKASSYGLVFIASMVFGGFIASRAQKNSRSWKRSTQKVTPTKGHITWRYLLCFIGGFLVLLGARLADGCTSEHMMSGMMQTALSGYLFTIAAFATGIPVAMLLYRKQSNIE